MATYVTRMFDMIDKICFDHYGDHDRRIVETVLDVNPGLEEYDLLLPPGITITLPERKDADQASTPVLQIQLW